MRLGAGYRGYEVSPRQRRTGGVTASRIIMFTYLKEYVYTGLVTKVPNGQNLEKLDSCVLAHPCGRAGGGLPSRQWATRSGCSVQNAHDAVAPRVRTFAEGAAPQSLNQTELLIPEHGNHVGPGSYSKHNEQVKQWGTPTPLGRNFV